MKPILGTPGPQSVWSGHKLPQNGHPRSKNVKSLALLSLVSPRGIVLDFRKERTILGGFGGIHRHSDKALPVIRLAPFFQATTYRGTESVTVLARNEGLRVAWLLV